MYDEPKNRWSHGLYKWHSQPPVCKLEDGSCCLNDATASGVSLVLPLEGPDEGVDRGVFDIVGSGVANSHSRRGVEHKHCHCQ